MSGKRPLAPLSKPSLVSAILIYAVICYGGPKAHASCIALDATAGENLAYRFTYDYVTSLVDADTAHNRLYSAVYNLQQNQFGSEAVKALTEIELAARGFDCAASRIENYKQIPSSSFSPKYSDLVQTTAVSARENYVALAKTLREIAPILVDPSRDLYLNRNAKLLAELKDRTDRVSNLNVSLLKIFTDRNLDASGKIARLSITANGRDDIVDLIDLIFSQPGAQAANQATLTPFHSSAKALRVLLFVAPPAVIAETIELEPVQTTATHVTPIKREPETNLSAILGLVSAALLCFLGKETDKCLLNWKRRLFPMRCIQCTARTRNQSKICDPCEIRMENEELKKTEYERQQRESRTRDEERRKREDADRRERQEYQQAEEKRNREENTRQRNSNENNAGTYANREEPFDPYEVLGVNRGATKEDIRYAYLDIIKQYHPDKVCHLGSEFQCLAEEKTRAINRAYDMLNSL